MKTKHAQFFLLCTLADLQNLGALASVAMSHEREACTLFQNFGSQQKPGVKLSLLTETQTRALPNKLQCVCCPHVSCQELSPVADQLLMKSSITRYVSDISGSNGRFTGVKSEHESLEASQVPLLALQKGPCGGISCLRMFIGLP